MTGLDKSYTATARFGATSDTLDAEGEITPLETPMPAGEELRSILPHFTGDLLQLPPMASAVKVGGKRLYELHRRGETVERQRRPVTVHSFTLLSVDPEAQTATFEISCSSGTYVRTLVADLAAALGTGAYLTALRRTRVGHLTVDEAVTPEDLTPDTIYNHIIQTKVVISHLPAVSVPAERRREVCNGRRMASPGMPGSFRVEAGEELLAVYVDEGREARPEVVLCGP